MIATKKKIIIIIYNNKLLNNNNNKQNNFLTDDSGKYCCDTISISCIVLSVSWTLREMSAASFFSVSSVVMTESSSRIWPLESFRTCSRFFSSCRNLSWNSPVEMREEYDYETKLKRESLANTTHALSHIIFSLCLKPF